MWVLLQISVELDFVHVFLLTVTEDMILIFKILVPSCNTDVPDALADHNVDRRNTDVSLPRRLWLLRRYVRHGLILLSPGTDCGVRRCSGNGSDNPPKCIVRNTKWTTMTPLSRNRMEGAMHTPHEHWQSLASQKGQHVPYMNLDGQHGDKLCGLNLNDDVESNSTREK